MRRALTSFLRFCLRVFFRRIEVVGLENVARDRPVIFAANHPNGLVDPLFVLCFASRPVSFLAKAPLFRYPLVGWFARALESIPVYRKQDGTAGSNKETFARAREVLAGGGSIAIFPEGSTHSEPRMRELKTGAARIALSCGGEIVPTGIYYTAKQAFRSAALVVFGTPIVVRAEPLSDDGEPGAQSVDAVTAAIEDRLRALTLEADSHAALDLIDDAAQIFSSKDDLRLQLELRRRFVAGYHLLAVGDPARLERLQSRVIRFVAELEASSLDAADLSMSKRGRHGSRLVTVLMLLPLAVLGAMIHYLPYRAIRLLARRFARGDEIMATLKILGALFIYPIVWMVAAWLIGARAGAAAGVAALILFPILGYVALFTMERLDETLGALRAIRRAPHSRLFAEREEIRKEMRAVAEEIGLAGEVSS